MVGGVSSAISLADSGLLLPPLHLLDRTAELHSCGPLLCLPHTHLVAKAAVEAHDDLILGPSPLSPLDVWVQVVVPPATRT